MATFVSYEEEVAGEQIFPVLFPSLVLKTRYRWKGMATFLGRHQSYVVKASFIV